jgi:hypothetical protein
MGIGSRMTRVGRVYIDYMSNLQFLLLPEKLEPQASKP